jgi:hypothetical protein
VIHLHADVSVLLHQLITEGGRGRAQQWKSFCLAFRPIFSLRFFLLADHADYLFAHSSVGGPLAAHQAIEAALGALDDVIARDLLRLAGGVIDHQRADAAPPRLLAVEEFGSWQFAHQVGHDVVDELALAIGAVRMVGGLCQLLLCRARDYAVHPRHHKGYPAIGAL